MRTFLITFSLIISFSTIVAQNHKLSIGVEGGYGISTIWGDDQTTQDLDNKPVYSFGGFVSYRLTKHFSLKTGVYYDKKGYDKKDPGLETINTFYYYKIPLLARFTFGKKFNYFANIGPYYAYNSFDSRRLDRSGNVLLVENQEFYSKNDFGLTTGLGIGYTIKDKWTFHIELQNNLGLYSLYEGADTSDLSEYYKSNIFNISYNGMIGVTYSL